MYGVDGTVYSIDLKSATDRWPLLLLFELIQALFDRSFASSVVNSTLGQNVFQISFVRQSQPICFVAGQPLGYYASWPLFALSHHVVIWYAAEQVYPGRVFRRYAVLGDDVVIADSAVATQYRDILSRIGVAVSEGKSLTSPSGACEFAKRFLLDKMTKNASPISLKKVATVHHPYGWYNYVITNPCSVRFSTLWVVSVLTSRPLSSRKHGIRARRMIVMLFKFRLMQSFRLDFALSVLLGVMIPPQVFGRVIFGLLEKEFKPKD